jgi:hypothetical protein
MSCFFLVCVCVFHSVDQLSRLSFICERNLNLVKFFHRQSSVIEIDFSSKDSRLFFDNSGAIKPLHAFNRVSMYTNMIHQRLDDHGSIDIEKWK